MSNGAAGRAAPTLGQDDVYLYGELLGLGAGELADLRAGGAIL